MAAVLLLSVSCNDMQKAVQTVGQNDTIPKTKTSVSYDGTYVGTLPCADCSGIYTEIVLNGNKYKMKEVYQGKGNEGANTFTEEGKYAWDDEHKIITLNGDDSERYEVGDNVLYALDMDGKRISGDLSNMFILHKK